MSLASNFDHLYNRTLFLEGKGEGPRTKLSDIFNVEGLPSINEDPLKGLRSYSKKIKGSSASTRDAKNAFLRLLAQMNLIPDEVVDALRNADNTKVVALFRKEGYDKIVYNNLDDIKQRLETDAKDNISFISRNKAESQVQAAELRAAQHAMKELEKASVGRSKTAELAFDAIGDDIRDLSKGMTFAFEFIKYSKDALDEFEREVEESLEVQDDRYGVKMLGVIDYLRSILNPQNLKDEKDVESFIRKLKSEDEYLMVAVLFSDIYKKLKDQRSGTKVEEEENYTQGNQEEGDEGAESGLDQPGGKKVVVDFERDDRGVKSALTGDARQEVKFFNPGSGPVTESVEYSTDIYLEKAPKIIRESSKQHLVTFKEKYKPRTSWQLEELRRYGL